MSRSVLALFLLLAVLFTAPAPSIQARQTPEAQPQPQSEPPSQSQPSQDPAEAARKGAHRKAVEAGKLIASGDLKGAQALAEQAVASDPDSAETHYTLALVFEVQDKLDKAEAEYRKMGVFAPEPLLEMSLARLYLRENRIPEAEEQARRAVEKNHWVMQPHMSLGAVLMRKADYNGAIEAFAEAVQLQPDDATARLSLADAYRDGGRFDEALGQYDRALQYKPNYPDALLGRARTWERMGRPQEAALAYEKLLKVAPANLAGEYSLAKLYVMARDPSIKNPARAIELALAACEQTGWEDRQVIEVLAEAYAEAGQTDRAAEVRKKMENLPQAK